MVAGRSGEGIKTAVRVFRIYQLFAQARSPQTLTDLARALELPVSSCHALLNTMLDWGYIYEVSKREGYYPTPRMLRLNLEINAHDQLLAKLMPILKTLRDQTGETVVLARRQDTRALYIGVQESLRTVRFTTTPGDLRPLHAAAAGKALLGVLPVVERDALITRLELTRFTDRTLATPEALRADLDAAALRGWYSSIGESVADAMALARPVRWNDIDHAISIVGPIARMSSARDGHLDHLATACESLETFQPA